MKTSDNTFIDYFINAITAENGISNNTQIAYRNDLIGFLKFYIMRIEKLHQQL